MIITTPYKIAERFIGVREIPGSEHNPQVMAMLNLDAKWPEGDEVPWCSGFVNYVFWLLRLPRSKSLRARSWLRVGNPVGFTEPDRTSPEVGHDVVILKRGPGLQPGPDVIEAPGHVGFFAGWERGKVYILGGNQGDEVNVRGYDTDRILGIRRIE